MWESIHVVSNFEVNETVFVNFLGEVIQFEKTVHVDSNHGNP